MIIQLVVCVVGLLMYALAANPKLVDVGKIMFWTGLLSFLLGLGGTHIPWIH